MTDIVEQLRAIVRNMDRVWVEAGCEPAPAVSPLIEAADEIEKLRVECLRLSHAEAAARELLREIREDAPHFGMPTTRIEAFLAATEGER